jgi:hypothetical protein
VTDGIPLRAASPIPKDRNEVIPTEAFHDKWAKALELRYMFTVETWPEGGIMVVDGVRRRLQNDTPDASPFVCRHQNHLSVTALHLQMQLLHMVGQSDKVSRPGRMPPKRYSDALLMLILDLGWLIVTVLWFLCVHDCDYGAMSLHWMALILLAFS